MSVFTLLLVMGGFLSVCFVLAWKLDQKNRDRILKKLFELIEDEEERNHEKKTVQVPS